MGFSPAAFSSRLQPQQLPVQHLGVVGLLFLFQKPAPGAADGVIAVEKAVVVQQFQRGEAVGLAKGAELGGGGPPVIVDLPLMRYFCRETAPETGNPPRIPQGSFPRRCLPPAPAHPQAVSWLRDARIRSV